MQFTRWLALFSITFGIEINWQVTGGILRSRERLILLDSINWTFHNSVIFFATAMNFTRGTRSCTIPRCLLSRDSEYTSAVPGMCRVDRQKASLFIILRETVLQFNFNILVCVSSHLLTDVILRVRGCYGKLQFWMKYCPENRWNWNVFHGEKYALKSIGERMGEPHRRFLHRVANSDKFTYKLRVSMTGIQILSTSFKYV